MTKNKSLIDPDGRLMTARFVPSSHCDARPANIAIDAIIIHGISLPPAQFGTGAVEAFFTDQLDFSQHPYFATIAALRVSAHLFITRIGEIIQFVPFTQRAWHAGQSSLAGREQCNDFSIGIELEGTDDIPYETIQYQRLAAVIAALQQHYPAITHERIVGHSDVAPGRKTDPGGVFDWDYLETLLHSAHHAT